MELSQSTVMGIINNLLVGVVQVEMGVVIGSILGYITSFKLLLKLEVIKNQAYLMSIRCKLLVHDNINVLCYTNFFHRFGCIHSTYQLY